MPHAMKQIRLCTQNGATARVSKQGKQSKPDGLLRRDSRKVEGNMAHNYARCIFRGKKEKTVGMDKMEYREEEWKGPYSNEAAAAAPPRPPRAECTRPMSVVGHPTHGRGRRTTWNVGKEGSRR